MQSTTSWFEETQSPLRDWSIRDPRVSQFLSLSLGASSCSSSISSTLSCFFLKLSPSILVCKETDSLSVQPLEEPGILSAVYNVECIVAKRKQKYQIFACDRIPQKVHGYAKMNCSRLPQILLPPGSTPIPIRIKEFLDHII